MEEYKGYVEHIIYRNEENTYTVFEVQCEEGLLTCTGFPPAISEGESCIVTGEAVQHAVYGAQFKVDTYRVTAPENSMAMLRYLSSGAVKGIGQALAARIVGRFGADTIRIGTGWQHLDCSSEQNRQRSIANFRELAQQAAEAGLTVIAGTSGRQIGSFARDLPSLKAYLEEAGMENVKAAVTLPELREAGMSYVSCRDYFEGKLGHLYLADTGGTVPGSGSADAEAFVAECDKEGYEGRLSLQISFRDCILTPDRWIFDSAAWLKNS